MPAPDNSPTRSVTPATTIAAGATAAAVFSLLLTASPTAAAPMTGMRTATGAECSAFGSTPQFAGDVPSSADVLGFELGSQEVTPRQIEKYVGAVDAASERVISGVAATSVAGRPLTYAVVGAPDRVTPEALAQISRHAQLLRD